MSAAGQRIFVLTGAGVSAGAGLPTYRSKGGLWDRHSLKRVGSISGYKRDPRYVLSFYNKVRAKLIGEPCAAHRALVRLEAIHKVTICTQNVDGLHQRAGSTNVIPIHGDLASDRCHVCGVVTPAQVLSLNVRCDACGRIGVLRPNVVWFGEMPVGMDEAQTALAHADCFVAIGTSGEVFPASSFVHDAEDRGIPRLLLNKDRPGNYEAFGAARYGEADVLVPEWVDEMLLAE